MLVSDDGRVLGTRNGTNITVDGETLPSAFYVAVVSANGRGGNFSLSSAPHAPCTDCNQARVAVSIPHRASTSVSGGVTYGFVGALPVDGIVRPLMLRVAALNPNPLSVRVLAVFGDADLLGDALEIDFIDASLYAISCPRVFVLVHVSCRIRWPSLDSYGSFWGS